MPKKTDRGEQKSARENYLRALTDEMTKLDHLIDRAKKYVSDPRLRGLERGHVELMHARASKRAERFEREIVKPLAADLKRREHDKRKRN